MDSERPDQYRGVPYLAQVIEPLLQLRRYTESELMAALVQSFFTAWIETETDPSGTPFKKSAQETLPAFRLPARMVLVQAISPTIPTSTKWGRVR